jgi:hypothetical protein
VRRVGEEWAGAEKPAGNSVDMRTFETKILSFKGMQMPLGVENGSLTLLVNFKMHNKLIVKYIIAFN